MPGETVLYEKRGRRYVPVSMERRFDAWPSGFHLVYCRPEGGQLVHFRVTPARAELLAALLEHQERLADMLRNVVEPTIRQPTRLKPKQQKAWDELKRAMGKDWAVIERNSAVAYVRELINWVRDDCILDQEKDKTRDGCRGF